MRLDVDIQNQLSHEKVVLATDQDLDGISIRALLLCFFRRFGLSLLKNKQICYLRTPLLYGKKKGKIDQIFFSMSDYKDFEQKKPDHGLKMSYVKGLGSWEPEDLKELFEKYGAAYFIKPFDFNDKSLEQIQNWMSKDTSEFRKQSLRGKEFDINGI
jgi:DNA gyrase/topoisomerase IV subunit B